MYSLSFGFVTLLLGLSVPVSAVRNSIYIIRNAEVASLGEVGFTPVGLQRATTCLPTLFGPESPYNIGYIITCEPSITTPTCHTALGTVKPLADALGIEVDTVCSTGDDAPDDCVLQRVQAFAAESTQAILIAWDSEHMEDLFEHLDMDDDEPEFPETQADVVFTIRNGHFINQSSQGCADIDGSMGLPMLEGGEMFPFPKRNERISRRSRSHLRRQPRKL
ncbi:hypothetical protein AX16_003837 [Volvariella volvacea WC 439]|nr:hypothetical protein AX16_003837 [Volvariella volvacea WC 439]